MTTGSVYLSQCHLLVYYWPVYLYKTWSILAVTTWRCHGNDQRSHDWASASTPMMPFLPCFLYVTWRWLKSRQVSSNFVKSRQIWLTLASLVTSFGDHNSLNVTWLLRSYLRSVLVHSHRGSWFLVIYIENRDIQTQFIAGLCRQSIVRQIHPPNPLNTGLITVLTNLLLT